MRGAGKKLAAFLAAVCLLAGLAGCASAGEGSREVYVFAASSLQEPLDAIIEGYHSRDGDVRIVATYDSSGTLLTQIREGAACDLFISAAPRQIDALDGSLADDPDRNPHGLDLLLPGSRRDLLENEVTLAVSRGNPAEIVSFDQLMELLTRGEVMLAVGNSDVPVGQYTQRIFDYYGISEGEVAACLTYGSNVKEVTTQISEGAVDCGIIYGSDAFSAGLTVVDRAQTRMCGQVIYPAAVVTTGNEPGAAQEFLDYLLSADARRCFEQVGFRPLA